MVRIGNLITQDRSQHRVRTKLYDKLTRIE